MSEKKRENCTVVSQECIAAGIYSLWIQTEKIAADAKPGQFVSMYTKDKTKLLPRPISICEIDKEDSSLHLVYRIAGKGTAEFSEKQMREFRGKCCSIIFQDPMTSLNPVFTVGNQLREAIELHTDRKGKGRPSP